METKHRIVINESVNEDLCMAKKDFVSGIILLLISLGIFVRSIFIIKNTLSIADDSWYRTPGIFTLFISSVLIVLSASLVWTSYKTGGCTRNTILWDIKGYIKTPQCIKFIFAVGSLGVYIFLLFGRINYCIATFLYLAATMLFFRESNFAIWKIIVIALIVTVALYYFF